MLDNPDINIHSIFSPKITLHLYSRGEAEVGSAEEQPARNSPVTDEVIHSRVWHLPSPFLCSYFRGLHALKNLL